MQANEREERGLGPQVGVSRGYRERKSTIQKSSKTAVLMIEVLVCLEYRKSYLR